MKDYPYSDSMDELELNKIYLGDCLDLLPNIPDNFIDMVLCDLPYQITSNSWDCLIPLDLLWEEYLRVGKENAVFVFTASQPFTSILVSSKIELFKHEWIWIKNRGSNFANTKREPMKEHESVLIFSRGKWTYNKQMQERSGAGLDRAKYNVKFESKSTNYRNFEGRKENVISNLRVPSSWQKFNTETGLHCTQKPVSLFKYLIKTYTNEGDVVLDNCIGSGTTAVACTGLNRRFIGMEKEEKYVDIARKRISETRPLEELDMFAGF